MAWDIVRTKSLKATIAIPTQFVFVAIDTNGQAVLPAAGAYAVGVIQDTPSAGDPTAVCFPGDVTKVLCSGTFAAGAQVMTDATGAALAATATNWILGIALSAGAAGFLADILYQPQMIHA